MPALCLTLASTACSFNSTPSAPDVSALSRLERVPPSGVTGAGKIDHIVYVIQENRSFDNIFYGYPGADTATRGKMSNGKWEQLRPLSLKVEYDMDHSAAGMFAACNGTGRLPGTKCRMDGFDKEASLNPPIQDPQYVYVPHSETKPYFAMAHEWVVADHTFASQLDESFVAHQYVIAAQAASSVNVPDGAWGCDGVSGDLVQTITHERKLGPNQPPCFDYPTLGDELDRAGLTWRFYTSKYTNPTSGFWSGYQAVRHIYAGPDWRRDIITPQRRFLSDVARGRLANFTWVTPLCPDSDHPDCGGGYGPSWVAAVVNAVGRSKFWKSTAIFVQWDDWGGLYDHVPPPFEGYDGLGFRVPLLVISPYAKKSYVSHVQYETASVLRFAEDLFGLGQLNAADLRATSPAADCFDFARPPRAFVPIQAPASPEFFLHQANDGRIPDTE